MSAAPTNYRSFVGKLDLTSNLSVHTDVFHVDTQSRKVSIGHTLPQQPLDVLGDIQATNFRGALIGNATTSTNTTGSSTSCTGNALTSSNTSGNATTATELASARDIGGVSFNGSADIDLPGVNTAGNQNTTGNAATASSAAILTNARDIGGVSFNGSADIDLPGVNTAGNQNTTGNAATSSNTSGNAATATALANAREIGGVSFDGTGNIDLPGVNTAGNQNTTGNAATSSNTSGNAATASSAAILTNARDIGGVSFNGSADIDLPGVNTAGNQNTTGNAATSSNTSGNAATSSNTSGNAATATALANAREIGGVSFDGTGNIDLPGVNTAGNQNTTGNAATSSNTSGNAATSTNTTGNAATATALANARDIGGVSFDGTANISLPGVNTAGNQNTSGNADTATALETERTIELTGDVTGSATFDGSGNISISTTSSGGGSWTSSGTTIYYNSGNVGINKTAPDAKLHVNGNAIIGDVGGYSSVTYTDAQLTLGGSHNAGYNLSNKVKLLITGGNNDGSSPYYIMCEDENGYDQFYVKGGTSSNGTGGKVFIKNSLGVGTTSPAQKLDVAGRIRCDTMEMDSYCYHVGDTNTYFGFNGNDHFVIVEGGGNRFQVDSNGYIGLADSSPSYRLDCNGTIRATGNVIAYSDRRAKSNIEKIQNSLEKIDKISGYTYTMKVKDKDDEPEKDERFTGLIAQEVLEILPEAVMGSEEDHYSLAYGNMAGLLVEGIKELTRKNEILETQLASVLARLDAIEELKTQQAARK